MRFLFTSFYHSFLTSRAGFFFVLATLASPSTHALSAPQLLSQAPSQAPLGNFAVTSAEYKLPAALDPEILSGHVTELWARVFRPAVLAGPRPILFFLHGNHPTCGKGAHPRIDHGCAYTRTGSCNPGEVVVPNHEGYNYAANLLASWGYIVVSINANRGINCGDSVPGDHGLVLARGRLVLKHIEAWYRWTTAGGAPASLGIGETQWPNAVDFANVGLMGHSRGGEGMRAAYNLYREDASAWPAKIPGLVIKGIFEIGAVDGQSERILNAQDTAWTQLLPLCDGDITDLQGRLPFERMMTQDHETLKNQKSLYMVWGANHNFFNSEWQVNESQGCNGYEDIFGSGEISLPQQAIAAQSMLSFFRAHIGNDAEPAQMRLFDPLFALPPSTTAITRVDRDFTVTADQSTSLRFDDFSAPTGFNSNGPANESANIVMIHQHYELPYSALVSWQDADSSHYLQTNWTASGSGRDVGEFDTLDFRVGIPVTSRPMQDPVDFSLQLFDSFDHGSAKVLLSENAEVYGPGNGVTTVYQTVRIPLHDFLTGTNDFDLTKLRGVRFIFDRSRSAHIALTQVRLSKTLQSRPPGILTAPRPLSVWRKTPAQLAFDVLLFATKTRYDSAIFAGHRSVVELTFFSPRAFPVTDELLTLRLAGRSFQFSRFAKGDTRYLIFTIPKEDYDELPGAGQMLISLGAQPGPSGHALWMSQFHKAPVK